MGFRHIQKFINGAVAAASILTLLLEPSVGQQRRGRVGASGQQAVEFDCPEDFGYYPHPSDCTQYYVCVFGDALLESCTGGLMYSHELQTCDWPRNVGCGADGESATISTVRVTDPRTRQTTPTGSSSRTVSISRGQQQQQQQQQREQQQRQQQEEIAKHQLYADDLGPAEEVESDRQQRVYRGQPSTVGQVARDRDGLRHQVTNAIPAPPGRVASGEKIGVISFGTQQQQQQQEQQQYSFDEVTLDDNFLLTNETHQRRREKRQIRYSRFPGQGGPVLQLDRPELNTLSLTVPVLSNGANYNSYKTFGPANTNDIPVPSPSVRPSNPAPPPSSDNNYRPIPNNVPNADIRHFRSPENYLTSGQRPPPKIQFTQTNNNFKPRPSQTPNPAVSAYNLRQYLNQPPDPKNTKLQLQQTSQLNTDLQKQQQQPVGTSNINLNQQNNVNSLLQTLHQNAQYLNPVFPVRGLGPTSFTNFQQISDIFSNPASPPTSLSPINHQQVYSQTKAVTRDSSISGINYHNQNPPEQDRYSHPLFDRPNMAVPAVQYAPSSTDTPTPIQQSSFQKYVTTLQNLPGGQTPLGFQYDALSSAEIHNHEQRETSQHLVSPPPPQQQTELPHYNQNQQQIQQTWQKLLREQQQQRNWSPVPQPTKSLPPTYNKHKKDTFSGPSHSLNFEDQSSEQLDLRTEGPFRPNTSPYGDSESFVGVVYKDNIREVSDLYTDLPSTADPSFNDQLGSNDYLRPQAAPPTRQPARQKANIPDKNLTEKPERNTRRPHNRKPVSYPQTTSRHNFAVESDGNQKHVVRTPDVAPHSDTTSIPHGKYESLKLPAQTKNGKLHGSDSQEDVYERKPEDYDKKVSYDEDETLEEKNPGSRKPEPERESQTNSDFRYRNRGNTHTETKTGRKRPQYNTEQSNRNIPQNRNRQPVRQETSEQTYDGDLPQTEESASSDQPDSYDTETHESDGSALSDKDQAETIPHLETTTEDRFPAPPPEFYEEFNKFKHITNPFASFDFDFDAYLDKLRGNPKPASEQESSKVQITNTEPPEVSNYDTEGDNINSTTYQNSESTTTTVKPNVQQVDHTEPSGQRTSQGLTKEYIKEYYPPPPRNAKNVYNEEIGAHNEEDEIQKHNQQGRPADTDTETVKGSAYQSEHITSTTHAPQLEIATVNHHIKPHPLTVPFYPGEDGNFYANPVHIQSQQPETTLAGRTQDTVLPTVTGNRYSVQEENFDTIQSTERIPHTTSTSKSYLQSHRNSNANNHKSYESTVTTPFPAGRDNVNPLHPVHVVVTTPSRGSKPPRRGPIRNMPQNSKHIYASQTMETNKANDGSRKNAYYDSAYHQQRVTKPRVRVKAPHTTPASSLPHPFTATAFSSNRYQYQGAQKTSTEHTTPRPLANPASSLTQSDTNPKKTGHSYIHISGEENDTIRPLKILQNERTPQSHKTLSTGIYNSPILSPTTEFLSTSSTTRYNDPKTYNSWQSTVPYQQEVSNFELTTPTHSKHKVTDDNSESRFNSESDLTTPSLPEYTTVTLINMHDIPSENTPITYSGVQTSTRPSNELLDSIYDIAKTMFKPQYDTASDPSSESANQNPFTKLSLFHPNVTTTTISSITHLKPGHQRPLNQIPRGPGIMNHVNKYTTSGADHTTHETYTTRHRPSNDHPSLPVRHRTHRPLTKSLQSSAANVITTTTSPSSDIHTTLIYPSPTHSQLPVMPRRLRRPPKVRFDVTSTEAYPDNDKSESIERPLQHNVNRLNKIPLGSTMTAAPHRVEPSVTPVTYAQQQAVQVPANANVYNNSQRYSPTQYDPYYNIYDEDVEIYRDVDYTQFPSNQGSRQTNANNQQPQYRGQSPYKQPPQGLTQQGQTNAAYAQPSHNTQQDVYVQNIDPQEYNENYNTAADDQTQYKQQSGVRQPNKSSSRPQTRLRVDPTITPNNKKYNAVLAAIATSSPKDQATPIWTSTTIFPNVPDFDTPYLLTLQDSKVKSNSRQATNTNSRQSNSVLPKSRRITLAPSSSLAELSSTATSKPTQPSRSRSSSRRTSLDPSTETATGRRGSEGVTLGASLSGTSRSGSQSASSKSKESDTRRTATKSFTIGGNTSPTSKAFSLEAEISAIENSFTLNNATPRRDEERGHSGFRTDPKISTKFQSQIQRDASEPVQRTRLVSESASSLSSDSNTSQEPLSSQRSAVSSRTPQSRQPETLVSRSTSETPRYLSQNAGSETVLSPSAQISTSSQRSDSRNEPNPTPSSSALRSSYDASLVEADDVNSGLSRNSIVQQSDVSINNRARSRSSSQRKPTSCADAVDTNSNAGCNEKLPIRLRPTTASPDSQSTPAPARGSNTGRTRGDPSYTTASGAEPNVNRGTPASVSRSRPTLKPSTAIVSKAQEFVDIYRYPPRRPDPVYPTPQVDKTAAKCRKDVCLLPDCYCGGKDIPGNLPGEEIPQIVLLTFDDAINDLNKGLYQDIFEKGRTNPNGCPITATFYVSHEWTDYSQVQNLYAEGHEMASHSISHSFGEQFSQKKWTREIAGQQEILAAYGGVRMEDIRGMRAPFLAIGGNKMFKMLYDSNFTYDSSMPVYENRPPSWPYTLDYKIFHDCMIPPCPTRSYPGVWEVPMVMWQDLNGGRCSMGDACSNPPTADGVYKMLIKNFERHYTTNRAPFGLFYHAAWFTQPHHKEGFIAFLDTIVNMQDVWLVTNWQAIQWVRDPTPLSRINSFPPFQCNYPERPRRCNNPKVCNLWHKSGVRYMRTCQPCPDVYPWTGKTGVRNSRVDNEIIEES
ncbi:mucin-12 isoform X4 [Cryptotermes secundus]|nr:mucin-12 isoform X4 [Cryptotermes secundus]